MKASFIDKSADERFYKYLLYFTILLSFSLFINNLSLIFGYKNRPLISLITTDIVNLSSNRSILNPTNTSTWENLLNFPNSRHHFYQTLSTQNQKLKSRLNLIADSSSDATTDLDTHYLEADFQNLDKENLHFDYDKESQTLISHLNNLLDETVNSIEDAAKQLENSNLDIEGSNFDEPESVKLPLETSTLSPDIETSPDKDSKTHHLRKIRLEDQKSEKPKIPVPEIDYNDPKPPPTDSKGKAWICPFDHPDKNKIFTPKYHEKRLTHVRPDKFLFSMSPFGPNNQFRGFRDNIMLAYYLNRTVVLPDFVKHITDNSYNHDDYSKNLQNINEKVDLYVLSKFINIITMQDLADLGYCVNQAFTTAYYARYDVGGQTYNQLLHVKDKYHFDILQNPPKEGSESDAYRHPKLANIEIYPDMVNGTNNRVGGYNRQTSQVYITMDNQAVQDAYGTNAGDGSKFNAKTGQGRYTFTPDKLSRVYEGQCSIYVQPFRNFDWAKPILKSKNSRYSIYDTSNSQNKMSASIANPVPPTILPLKPVLEQIHFNPGDYYFHHRVIR